MLQKYSLIWSKYSCIWLFYPRSSHRISFMHSNSTLFGRKCHSGKLNIPNSIKMWWLRWHSDDIKVYIQHLSLLNRLSFIFRNIILIEWKCISPFIHGEHTSIDGCQFPRRKCRCMLLIIHIHIYGVLEVFNLLSSWAQFMCTHEYHIACEGIVRSFFANGSVQREQEDWWEIKEKPSKQYGEIMNDFIGCAFFIFPIFYGLAALQIAFKILQCNG